MLLLRAVSLPLNLIAIFPRVQLSQLPACLQSHMPDPVLPVFPFLSSFQACERLLGGDSDLAFCEQNLVVSTRVPVVRMGYLRYKLYCCRERLIGFFSISINRAWSASVYSSHSRKCELSVRWYALV